MYTHTHIHIHCCWLVAKFCDPMDCSWPGSSVSRISQARILKWVAISFSNGSSQPKEWTCVSCISRRIIYHWATREAHTHIYIHVYIKYIMVYLYRGSTDQVRWQHDFEQTGLLGALGLPILLQPEYFAFISLPFGIFSTATLKKEFFSRKKVKLQ